MQRDLADAGEPGSGRGLTYRDVVVACPPCGGGLAYTALLDLTLLTGATLVAAPLPLVPAAHLGVQGLRRDRPAGHRGARADAGPDLPRRLPPVAAPVCD